MLLAKLRTALATLLALAALGLGAWGLAYRTLAADKPGGAKEGTAKADLERLQGTWELVSMEMGDREVPAEEIKGFTLVIKDDQATLSDGKGRTQEAVLKLDPAKDPKEIDMAVNEDGKDEVHKGIYKLKGDTLTLCKSHPPDERPGAFGTKEGSKWPAVFVFKKQAAK
jgi:uncharacterized protein (TIGR03067 family)